RDLLARSDSVIGITAQGRFADVRERPVALARGLAHLARAAPHAAFIPLALDYPFWNTERPEALARFGPRVQVAVGETVRSTVSRFEAALEGVMAAL
ncbi:hypothetical protein, partial [Shewanella algae]|uniref:hypothetical protein n=1 Tax=Shewanella algae TaxID=38313 RepID=UPI00313D9BA1